jgi:hypothetical protein
MKKSQGMAPAKDEENRTGAGGARRFETYATWHFAQVIQVIQVSAKSLEGDLCKTHAAQPLCNRVAHVVCLASPPTSACLRVKNKEPLNAMQ